MVSDSSDGKMTINFEFEGLFICCKAGTSIQDTDWTPYIYISIA